MSHDAPPRLPEDTADQLALPECDMAPRGGALCGPAATLPAREPDVPLREALHRVNAFFYNKKVGLGLILAMAFLTLMGTLLEQAPDLQGDAQAWESWVESVRPRYGGWTLVLAATGMFGVFGSIWFKAVTILLAISIIACTCHRVPQLWQRAVHPHTHVSEAFFDRAGVRAAATMAQPVEESAELVRAALTARRYRVVADPRGPGRNLYADRARWAPFGTALAHASFVIILLGVLVTTTFGFKEPGLPVPVGTRVEIGHGTGLAVEARSFTDKYTDEGRPLDYFSDLVLYQGGGQVGAQVVRVNSPLRYDGVSIHQASYGIAAAITVKDRSGAQVHSSAVPLAWQSDDKRRSIGKVRIEGTDLTAYVVSAASGVVDPQIGAGQVLIEVYRAEQDAPLGAMVVSQGRSAQIGDLTYTFDRERQYTGLMIVRDPGAIWVWIGSGLMVIGLLLTMGVHHRRIWVRLQAAPDGGTAVRLASPERQDTTYERWLHRFAAGLSDPRPGVDVEAFDCLDRHDRLHR